ncbi:CRP-like cAMP-binding protein [Sphingomonas kyeonggiensis]|nr:CRP-like cAMP-binding protein [Sphingomonas kyeonggiensis]
MSQAAIAPPPTLPALRRLAALGTFDEAAGAALHEAARRARRISVRHELLSEGKPVMEPQILLSGWAARIRILPDGRRQIMGLLLPGDLIGHCYQPQPLATSTIMALTDLEICSAPSAQDFPSLECVYATSHALDEAFLLAQITRLGRMNASERLADLFLELFERLSMAGLTRGNAFEHPLTQELVADVTGLTPVHVNRVVKTMRQDDEALWAAGYLVLSDPQALASRIGWAPFRVSLSMHPRR